MFHSNDDLRSRRKKKQLNVGPLGGEQKEKNDSQAGLVVSGQFAAEFAGFGRRVGGGRSALARLEPVGDADRAGALLRTRSKKTGPTPSLNPSQSRGALAENNATMGRSETPRWA